MENEDIDTLKLTWSMEIGAPGTDDSPDNPFSRAVARLFREGKPFPRLTKCFFKGSNDVPRWLGVIVHSAGDRILFFPGYSTTPTAIRSFVDNTEVWNREFVLDHVSLESDLKTWHVTSPNSADHLGKPRTLELGDSRVLWFGLSFSNEEALRLVRQETVVSAAVPSSDAQRRVNAFKSSREGTEFSMISLNTEQPRRVDVSFLHFAFVVGPRSFPSYLGNQLAAPVGSPFLASPLQASIAGLPLRNHRVQLSSSIDIEITSCELPGSLTVPMIFTSPFNREPK
jgi:hypothetical protein